jgi:putative DNA primase/helicase
MRSVRDLLDENDIELPDTRDGKYDVVCPECSHRRKPDHQKLACLAVKIEGGRVVWKCHNCGWKGPEKGGNSTADFAIKLWCSSVPATGTLVEVYLRARGITIPPPPTLRFLPTLLHTPTKTSWPVMVAQVQDTRGVIIGIHRTYLQRDGGGKALVEKAKMMLGPCRGGAVWLADAAEKMCVSEGIETGLSVLQATGIPTWAGLSDSGVKAMRLPAAVREVTICADADEAGERAAQGAAQRWLHEGRRVLIARPPPGKDFNDLLILREDRDDREDHR